MAELVIEVKGLWARYGTQVVHRNVDLSVRRGEIMSLVGDYSARRISGKVVRSSGARGSFEVTDAWEGFVD